MEVVPRPKKAAVRKGRKGNVKVRTGCITCKVRHVKCDETRPLCNRCAVGLRECSWPLPSNKHSSCRGSTPSLKMILPRTESTLFVPSIASEPSVNLFLNNQEMWYFQLYTKEVYRDLSGPFKSEFWDKIVLQAAHGCTYIRSAVIAIAGLASRARSSVAVSTGINDINGSPVCEEQFALAHYQKFLLGTRQKLEGEIPSTRLAMISCLLVACIENLQWHHQSAMKTLWSGLSLFDEWLEKETLKIDDSFRKKRSPSPTEIEYAIIDQIKIYDSQTSWLIDPRPVQHHARLRFEGQQYVESMSKDFQCLEEAKMVFELLFRRVHHFIASIRPGKFAMPKVSDAERYFLNVNFDGEDSQVPVTADQIEAQKSYKNEIKKWERGFAKLLERTTTTSPEFIGVNLLKIRSRLLSIMLVGQLSKSEMVYDQYTDAFEEIIQRSKNHFAHDSIINMKSKGVYSLNTGLSYPLFITASKCRVRHLRREAIDLLMRKPWREGIMVSFTGGLVGRFTMRLEEKGLRPDEAIPEHRRTTLLSMKFIQEDLKRTLSLKGTRGRGSTKEIVRETWEWTVEDTPCSNNGLHVVALGLKISESSTEIIDTFPRDVQIEQDLDLAEIEHSWRPNIMPFRTN